MFFVHRSFYSMRIESSDEKEEVSVSSKVA
jgi:hypothetical protein